MNDALDELRVYAAYIRRIALEAVATLQDLTDRQLNWKTGEDGSNTMFAIATHMVAMGEYWVLCLVGGADIVRARQAEFHAVGSAAEIVLRLQNWSHACDVLCTGLGSEVLAEIARVPIECFQSGGFWSGALSKRECLVHVVEHSALHLGQLQILRQLVERQAILF